MSTYSVLLIIFAFKMHIFRMEATQNDAFPSLNSANISQPIHFWQQYCAHGSSNYYYKCLERQRGWYSLMRTRWSTGRRGIESCSYTANQLYSECLDKTKGGLSKKTSI